MIDIDTEFAAAEARLRAAAREPERAQEALLRDILVTNRDTEYGRRFDFASIGDLPAYRARLPLLAYGDVAPYVDRMVAGERDVLFAGAATFFGCTSGTTSVPKRIGFNPRVRDEYVHMLGPMIAMMDRDFPAAGRHTLLLTAQFDESRSPAGVPIGNASGFVRRALDEHPYFRFVPEPIYECHDPQARTYVMLLCALARPMRCFAALFPVLLTNLFHRATELADALAHDLEHGRLEAGPAGIGALAAALAPRLRPLPDAARRLRDVVRVHGAFVPHEYWPEVDVLHVWKGGTAKQALPELQAMFPRAQIRPMSSGSTEASLMVALENGWAGGIPALCSTVMDFLPADAAPEPGAVVTLRDLEPGRGYRLVVTNHRGLYRYVMEDVFVIEGYHDATPYLRLDHRVGIVSSTSGEKVTEEQVSHAIDRAIAATGLSPAAYQVAPEQLAGTGASYRYTVQVELATAAARELLQRFVALVEADLYEHNSQYALNRNIGTLGPAALRRMRPGYFDELVHRRSAARGRTDVQFKLVALDTELYRAEPDSVLDIVIAE